MTEDPAGGPSRRPADRALDDLLVGLADRWRTRRRGPRRRRSAVLVYWPVDEWSALAGRWPELAAAYGGDPDEHRRHLEETLVDLSRRDSDPLGVAPMTVQGLRAYAERTGSDPGESSTRAAYAAQLGRAGQAVSWPPRPGQRCWCGSGRRYRDCCAFRR